MVVDFHQFKKKSQQQQQRKRESTNGHEAQPDGHMKWWVPLLAEFIGTLLFTLVAVGGVVIGHHTGELAHAELYIPRGIVLIALIFAFGATSGAHFNPAVTYAFALRGAFPWGEVPRYWIMQFLGAISGAWILSAMLGGVQVWDGPQVPIRQAFWCETIFAFLLITVILSTARQNKLIGHNAAVAVGTTLIAIGMLAGPLSGGVVNPAKSLGPALVTGDLHNIWLYIVGPFLGATAAAWINFLLHGRVNKEEAKNALGREQKGEEDAQDKPPARSSK